MSPPAKKPVEDDEPFLAPRENPALFGQAEAETAVLEAWSSGRMPHAWLISGPKGVGKATLAHRMARFVLASGGEGDGLFGPPESLALDPNHPVFRRAASGGHADLRTVEIGINPRTGKLRTEIVADDVRELAGFFHMTAAEGGWRVAVIDAADDMNRTAANAVLKILEEPPPDALLLLVSHGPARLLPTIRSRCRKLVLRALAEEDVVRILRDGMPEIGEEEARLLARLSEGSPGRAIELARREGPALYRQLLAVLEGLPVLDIGAIGALGDKAAGRGADNESFETVAELLRGVLSRLVRAKATGEISAPDPAEAALLTRLIARGGLEPWADAIDAAEDLLRSADPQNLDRRQVLQTALLGLEAPARA
ncbi:MAG: DNA polymerase III subunit delta' [Rhodospirillaceae bacterium]|nr:DNA polymerase III subunit delta' [Rhodospirillaceae bacterium]